MGMSLPKDVDLLYLARECLTAPLTKYWKPVMNSKGESYYVVGGRAYFEAYAVGSNLLTFTTKGFFDKANYQEPLRENSNHIGLILGITFTLVAAVAIIGVIIFYCCMKKKNKKEVHTD